MHLAGHCRITMANGQVNPISSLAKGDQILCYPTPPGDQPMTAKVACILVYPQDGSRFSIAGLNLECTEELPIKDPSTGKWNHAEEMVAFSERRSYSSYSNASPSYSVLLEKEAPSHTIIVENVVVAALGCSYREGYCWDQGGTCHLNPWWEFFGDYERVSEEMQDANLAGFQKGRVFVDGIRRCGDDDGFFLVGFTPVQGPMLALLENHAEKLSEGGADHPNERRVSDRI
jgi:hypothetical protein